MRPLAVILVLASTAAAQFKSTAPLVVAPTSIKDPTGQFVDGLTASDLILYDNNVPQILQLDWSFYPISLVVAVQATFSSAAVLDKFNGSGILLTQLLAADAGETAVLSYNDHVQLRQDFTAEPDAVAHALLRLNTDGEQARALDAMMRALQLLSRRPAERRRIILMIGEKRDRGSGTKLAQAAEEVERQNAAVYWLAFSPSWTAFTHRPPTRKDRETRKEQDEDLHRDDPVPAPDPPPPNLLRGLTELAHLSQPDLADLFTRTTGARSINFLRKRALEDAIEAIGAEVHRQYVITFQPSGPGDGRFHAIRVAVKGRPDLQVRTRSGYWSLP